MKNDNELDEMYARFVRENGGVELVRAIASGTICDDQKIVAAAKAFICKVEPR